MKVYVLRKHTSARPHGLYDDIIDASTKKRQIFDRATSLSLEELNNRSSWQDIIYWIEIFDNKTGKKIDELEFVNDRRESTFGKIVHERGGRDQRVVGSWHE